MPKSYAPRLSDMIEAIERIRAIVAVGDAASFEAGWREKWLVERGLEIVSEASRHLPEGLKSRHPQIPWKKVAGIGNVLRHDYGDVAAPILWKLAVSDLAALERVCRAELASVGV